LSALPDSPRPYSFSANGPVPLFPGMDPGEQAYQQVLMVGKDRLTITEQFVYIDAARVIPDWQVREFQRMPIFLGDDFKFFLRNKLPADPPFAIRYILERWPADAHFDAGPISFTYDEQFVLERDAQHAEQRKYEQLGKVLLCVYPLLGFLWSRTKEKLIPAGVIPRSVTGVSIFACFCLILLQGSFLRMRMGLITLTFGETGILEFNLLMADVALTGLMLLDSILRFDQHMKDVEHPWGFCEWMIAPFRRKRIDQEQQS
jgi:hypothetical protein